MCYKTPTAAQGRVTSPWCGGETGGGPPRADTQSGGSPGPAAAARARDRAPHPSPATLGKPRWNRAGPTGGWRYAGVTRVPCDPAPPGLVCAPLPQPTAPCVLRSCIMGWGYRPIRRPSGPGAQPLWPSARGLMSRGATGPALRCNAGQPRHQASQPRALLHLAGCLDRSWEVVE